MEHVLKLGTLMMHVMAKANINPEDAKLTLNLMSSIQQTIAELLDITKEELMQIMLDNLKETHGLDEDELTVVMSNMTDQGGIA